MKIEEYQKEAYKRLNPAIANNPKERMNYTCMGVIEETGEVIAELRKAFYKGNFHERKLNKTAIEEECGDLIWYLLLICKNRGICIETSPKKTDSSIDYKMIEQSIKLGVESSKIVEGYIQAENGKMDNEELKEKITTQIHSIEEFLRGLDIELEETLGLNMEKINKRYDEEGTAIKGNEGR